MACDTPENLRRRTGRALELEVLGAPEAVRAALGALPGGSLTTLTQARPGHTRARLETDRENLEDLSQAVFFRLAECALPLLSMVPVKASLEEIFLELTEGKEEG